MQRPDVDSGGGSDADCDFGTAASVRNSVVVQARQLVVANSHGRPGVEVVLLQVSSPCSSDIHYDLRN